MPYVSGAKSNGFDDVLWLLDDFIQEMTALNVFFLLKTRYGRFQLLTPMDNGCIMPGITRQSIMELKDQIYKDKNIEIVEKDISIHEIIAAHDEQRLVEVIGCGTGSHV